MTKHKEPSVFDLFNNSPSPKREEKPEEPIEEQHHTIDDSNYLSVYNDDLFEGI